MKRLVTNLAKLFALWIVIAVTLFLFLWLVVPQIGVESEYDGRPVNPVAARTV
ncbi:conserved protein of unknown function [Burkholderia multivorans]